MGKKNIDKLFHEKLKDYSDVPNEKVWQSIEASLDKKKKSRKIIPIWWKLGGIAALLLIGVFIWNPFSDTSVAPPIISDVDSNTEKTSEEKETEKTFQYQNSNEVHIVDSHRDTVPKKEGDSSIEQVANANAATSQVSDSDKTKEASQKEGIRNQNAIGVQIANSIKVDAHGAIVHNGAKASENNIDEISPKNEIVESGISNTILEKNSPKDLDASKDLPLLNDMDNSVLEGIAQNEKEEAIEHIEASKKKSLFDEIAKQEQEEVAVQNSESKWSAGPSIAPVYFDAIGEGSPVHSIFIPNSKSGDVNLSYGLSVAYEVSKKLSIRSGVHKVDFGYRTNDVEFSSSPESAVNGQIDNIDYTLTSKSLVVSSKANASIRALNQDSFSNSALEDVSAASAARVGTMEQQFEYLEVPVELNYAIVDTRFGINLIGGVSSLFLIDNSISLSSGELTTGMGEANNVNRVNFSTNIGFGVNYKFTRKVRLNIEPVFKYQLNTFSETDGTFNPFSIGVYSGLNFKF